MPKREVDIYELAAWLTYATRQNPMNVRAVVLTRPLLQKICELTETPVDDMMAYIRTVEYRGR